MKRKYFIIGILIFTLFLTASCTKKEPASTEVQSFFYHILLNEIETVEEQLKAGFNPNVTNEDGYSALHYAIFIEHFEIAELLLVHGADYELKQLNNNQLLIEAVFRGSTAVAKEMINNGGYNLNEVGNSGWPPLLEGIRFGHLEIVQLLLENNVEVNFADSNGWTALHEAAYSGYNDIMKLLLEAGADFTKKNERGFTPLHVATLGGFSSTVELLLENGAAVNDFDVHQRTPLHIASEQGYLDVVHVLLKYGINKDLQDENGQLAIEIANQWGKQAIVEVLK